MPTIEEERKRAIAEQINRMAGVETPQTEEKAVEATSKERIVKENREKKENPTQTPQPMDLDRYLKTFLSPLPVENRVSFSLSRETLDMMRNILHALRCKCTLTAYIENILRAHVDSHKELISKGIEQNRRKSIIP